MAIPFLPGDLVVSIFGNGDGSGPYTDNQAAPIVLQELTTSGTATGSLVLPQTTSVRDGVTQYAISGEYGSSSEGSLSLSTDGQSLTIAGYAINAQIYNSGGAAVYGDARLAQSTSVQGGTYTPVQRAIADIRYDGTVDTSTALYNVDNGNNPRSVVTDDGSSFYLSGQGQSGDTTQGVFRVKDGAATATPIDNTSDTRSLLIDRGTLYVSRDTKQSAGDSIASYGGEPTAATTPTALPGLSGAITLTAAQANGINNSRIGTTVYLSPQNFFFASPTTLYVADGGQPKSGNAEKAGLGDGGLQKWVFANSKWSLQYTLSAGLNLVDNSSKSGTTGLIGLAGSVDKATGVVSLYATNSTVGDLDQTYLYGVQDQLAATAPAKGEAFTALYTAAAGTNVRGVAFAPQAACYVEGTRIRTARGDVPVEALAVGDHVEVHGGGVRPILWLGHRTLACAGQADLWPVRVRAGAFGVGDCGRDLPERDLRLSPGHPVLVGEGDAESLVPIMCLINGTSIAREGAETVTYWHVELDAHDVLLAEGLPSESFLDWGHRGWFAEGADHALLNPDFVPPGLVGRCRPVVVDGPRVERERRRIDALFATGLARPCSWPSLEDGVFRGL